MSVLFEKTKINGLDIKNRFVRSATWEGMATRAGEVTDGLIGLNANLAKNHVGLIISGHAYVLRQGQATPWQLGVYNDKLLGGLERLADAVHKNKGKIFLQIAHAGGFANSTLTGKVPLGPSIIMGNEGPICRKMTKDDIKKVVEAMKDGAIRAKKSGFDGVQIHSAHGYLLSQFLSPCFNKREDEYGGDIKGRARLLLEVVRAVRDEVGNNFPVTVKINSEDFTDPGFSAREMVDVVFMLENAGIDAVEISGGVTVNPPDTSPVRKGLLKTPEDEVYYMEAALKLKNKVKIPVMLVGGIRSFEVAQSLVDNKLADFISLSRPLIREPDLIKRWMEGEKEKAACLSCNKCFVPARSGKGLYCMVEEKLGRHGKDKEKA